MSQFFCFQFNSYKAFQNIVIENQIDKEIAGFHANMLLARRQGQNLYQAQA